jgi:hypothetical protein
MGRRLSKVTSSLIVLSIKSSFAFRYESEYEESKRQTKEVLHPLKLELADLDDQVRSAIVCIYRKLLVFLQRLMNKSQRFPLQKLQMRRTMIKYKIY